MTRSFHVSCLPVPQPRQRHGRIKCKDGREFTHNYTPTKHPINAFKAAVQQAYHTEFPVESPLDGPLSITLLFLMPRPTNKVWKRRPMPREPYVGKADWENLAKGVCDALNGLAWRDDRQIWMANVAVQIASGDEQPGVDVQIFADSGLTATVEIRYCGSVPEPEVSFGRRPS